MGERGQEKGGGAHSGVRVTSINEGRHLRLVDPHRLFGVNGHSFSKTVWVYPIHSTIARYT